MSPRFRKIPYPYAAAVTLTNDIDGLPFETFLELHRFLNTSDTTPVGEGLDLDVSDSFWFFSGKPARHDAFSFFEGLSARRSVYAGAMVALAETGYLDSLHTWGNFSEKGGYHRKYAELAAAELSRWKRKPLVWINHGDEHNTQNLYAHSAPELDLIEKLGFTFFWAGDTTSVWGQERDIFARERIRSAWAHLSFKGKCAVTARELLQGRQYARILSPAPFPTRYPTFSFTRYLKSWDHASSDDLGDILSERALEFLEERQSMVSVLIHLGFGKPFPFFSETAFAGLRRLSRKFREKKIWVASTERFLLHLAARRLLTCELDSDGALHLRWSDGAPPAVRSRGLEAVHGLTVYLADPARLERVSYESEPVDFEINAADATGSKSVTLRTWTRPPFPYRELCQMGKVR